MKPRRTERPRLSSAEHGSDGKPDTNTEVRLQKFLADAGIASRRASEQLILDGRVAINGVKVDKLGTKVPPTSRNITVDGYPVRLDKSHGYTYLALHKPRGYVVTAKDPEGRKTVYHLLKNIKTRVVPVGRLDRDTEGLILMTDDGELTYRLTHPSFQVEKEYKVKVEGALSPRDIQELRDGVELEDGITAPARAEVLDCDGEISVLSIAIKEGRNRQVRRMCDAIGHPVIRLVRVREGSISLENLRNGHYRTLTPAEVKALKKEVGLDK